MQQALYWEKQNENIKCQLCPQGCLVSEGEIGLCRVRRNVGGELYALNYGKVSSVALDPIEKKPLYHFHPGKKILSVGTLGCNLKCSFCQNWSIAHADPVTMEMDSESIVDKAVKLQNEGNIGIAFTYNEPSIWYEFVLQTSILSHKRGLLNVLVTNGFINKEPLEELLPYIDAMNIDVKAFSNDYYTKICKGNLDDVKRTVEISAAKCHVEVTTLVIPGLNDKEEEMQELAEWLSRINPEIPLHLSRYFPSYKMKDRPPTPLYTLDTLKKSAEEFLKYVYLGNV